MPKIQYKEINFRGKSLELINLVNQVINEYKNQGYELTLRQTYYQLVARGYIPNNERITQQGSQFCKWFRTFNVCI